MQVAILDETSEPDRPPEKTALSAMGCLFWDTYFTDRPDQDMSLLLQKEMSMYEQQSPIPAQQNPLMWTVLCFWQITCKLSGLRHGIDSALKRQWNKLHFFPPLLLIQAPRMQVAFFVLNRTLFFMNLRVKVLCCHISRNCQICLNLNKLHIQVVMSLCINLSCHWKNVLFF